MGKILPAVLAADSDSSGGPAVIRFERIIVMPDGQKYIEGVMPKQLPAPASHTLPNSTHPADDTSDVKDLDG